MAGIESIRLGGEYRDSFGQYSLADLLLGILRGNLTGALEVDLGTNRDDRVYFRDGVPVSVILPSVGISLAEVLVACGEIDQGLGLTVQRAANQLSQSESKVFGKTDACPDGALQKGMRLRARAELVKLFDVGDRAFRFREGVPLPDLADVTILQPLPLIYEGLLSSRDRTLVRMFLERTGGKRFLLVDTYPAGVDAFEWGDEVEKAVQSMNQPRSIEELAQLGLPLDQLAAVLCTLSMTGMLESVGGAPAGQQPLRLKAMSPSGEHALPSREAPRLRPMSGTAQDDERKDQELPTSTADSKNSNFQEKVVPLIGKNYFEILRVTPSSKPEQLDRALRFLRKNIDSGRRGERALALLAVEAHEVLSSPELGPKYREYVENSSENPKFLALRYQMEFQPKLTNALECISEGFLEEADVWLTWAAKLDPSRSDLRLHRSFLSLYRATPDSRVSIASALRDILVKETMQHPQDLRLQVYLACVVAVLGDTDMVESITAKPGVAEHTFAHLIQNFMPANTAT